MMLNRVYLCWPCFFFMALLTTGSAADTPDREAYKLCLQGECYMEQGDYAAAVTALESAVEKAPGNARYHHLLGKSYGELARSSNWIKAVGLAKKTRRAFERAVELDPDNIAALSDLMEYYKQAPFFLGGSKKEARRLEEKIAELKASQ